MAPRIDCYVGNMTKPCGHLTTSFRVDYDAPHQPALNRYHHAGSKCDRSRYVLLVVLSAIVSILLSCNTGRGAETAADNSKAIVMIPTEELTIDECEEVFGASAMGDSLHANKSMTAESQVEEAIGQFLVPEAVPSGLTLNSIHVEGQVAYIQYRGTSAEGRRVPVLTIEQGPTGGQVWTVHAKEGHFSEENVDGASAFFVQGGLVIRARIADGVATIDSCGWDPEEENSLFFVTNGHAVRIAGSPASDFPPSQLRSLAASLITSHGDR